MSIEEGKEYDEAEKPQTSDDSEATQTIQTTVSARNDPIGKDADPRNGEEIEHTKWNGEPSKPKRWKKFRDGQKSDWWFASTGIPLLAATLGPLANVSSIAALITSWRQTIYIDGEFVADFDGVPFGDPPWCYWLNVASLICGFLGNLFLLLNFTQRIRYLFALPATIIFWYLSTGFLIGITACMQIYAPPNRPYETYTQGFWYAIAAAAFYLICSMILMVNMLGYFLGHYPDHFALSDAQRTLILQTMVFFIWVAAGAAIFSRIETDTGANDWSFADGLYFCDVTLLTVGFGDLYPTSNLGRGMVFPYSVGGIITLALVVSSIYKFMRQLGEENIIQKHVERMRERAVERTVTNSFDLRQRENEAHRLVRKRGPKGRPQISSPQEARPYRTAMGNTVRRVAGLTPNIPLPSPLKKVARKPRLLLLREEKDRFDAMRKIQRQTAKFKKWYALTFSVLAFGTLWGVGAVVFWQAEKSAQGMTYFQALYFCYISLLTIGYGDLAPKSNAGRCFFVVWSLIAVPTMTILVSDMGDTVVEKFKTWSNDFADFTVLPKEGIWRVFLEEHPWLLDWLQRRMAQRAAAKRVRRGFDTTDPDDETNANITEPSNGDEGDAEAQLPAPTLPSLAAEATHDVDVPPTQASLSRHLAHAIQLVSRDLRRGTPKAYTYEEWVEFTRLIRFSRQHVDEVVLEEEEEEGLVEWDWIGEDSPLIGGMSESEWLIERLTESLIRLERRKEGLCQMGNLEEMRGLEKGRCVGREGEEEVGVMRGANGGVELSPELGEGARMETDKEWC